MQGRVDAIGARRLGNPGDAKDAKLLPVLEAMFKHFLVGLAEFSVDDVVIALDELIDIRRSTVSDHGASDPETHPGQSFLPRRDEFDPTKREFSAESRSMIVSIARPNRCDDRFIALVERPGDGQDVFPVLVVRSHPVTFFEPHAEWAHVTMPPLISLTASRSRSTSPASTDGSWWASPSRINRLPSRSDRTSRSIRARSIIEPSSTMTTRSASRLFS